MAKGRDRSRVVSGGGLVGPGVAGIDPHKRSLTVAVVTGVGELVATASFAVTVEGVRGLLAWLAGLVQAGGQVQRIGVEGAGGLGAAAAQLLANAGYDVREVPPTRTADRRRRRGRAKTDQDDAIAIARETLSDPDLPPAGKAVTVPAQEGTGEGVCSTQSPIPSPQVKARMAVAELTALRAWRQAKVKAKRRLLNQAEGVLIKLPLLLRDLLPTTSKVTSCLTTLAELTDADQALLGLTTPDRVRLEHLAGIRAEITELERQLRDLDKRIPPLLRAAGCTLTTIHGIGVVTAMTIITQVGDPHRFATESAFARWCGIAPLPISSGEGDAPPNRHRLDLGGNRDVNSALHIIHVTQARLHPPARAYLQHRASLPGHTPKIARRAHKRMLANTVIRHMWADADRLTHPITVAA